MSRSLVALAAVLATSSHAWAYSYESAVSPGCHERISMAALRTLRTQIPTAPAALATGDDLALIGDLPFSVDDDMKDVGAASFLVGVRDNDLHGRGPTEVSQLAAVHGNPENQKEHCLRAIDDDEPGGSVRALETCKAFIREKIVQALDGLDPNGIPDLNHRVDIDVSLSLRGGVTATLPQYWVNVGQAIHTLQDSFTHTFRTPDRMRVRTVLNWIEYINGNETESRDGPVHRNGLDQCDKLDDLRNLNLAVATQASVDLLHATLDPGLSRDAKLAAVDATLVKYLSYEPGCTEANGWCDAPEREYAIEASCGCSVLGARSGGVLAAGACLLGLAFLVARRRRRLATLPILLACFTFPALAHAQPSEAPPESPPPAAGALTTDPKTGATVSTDEKAPPPGVPTVKEAKAEQTETEHQGLFGIYAATSGSVTNPGLSGQLGIRFRISQLLSLGLDGELNGWYGVQKGQFRTGAFNAYATGIIHYPIRFSRINLRSTLNFGTSTMLIDLYGAPRGSTGIFFGIAPLGLEVKLSSKLYLVFDALGIALPVPQLKGAPFAYPQYRTALGLELTF